MRQFGAEGQRLWRLARGVDPRQVTPEREVKSISAETTFESDLATNETLAPALLQSSEKSPGISNTPAYAERA